MNNHQCPACNGTGKAPSAPPPAPSLKSFKALIKSPKGKGGTFLISDVADHEEAREVALKGSPKGSTVLISIQN